MPLFRQGDGIDLPMVDETGDALQIGISVERFPAAKESTETIAKELAKGSTKDPRLQMAGTEAVESVTLSDQTEATLLTMELIKSGSRRSLYMKLIGKDATGRIWIVSGFIVGGKESKWPKPNSMLCAWLRAHVVSLTLTSKEVDPKGLEAAYKARDAGA
ncbi:hypothetical protein [Prosthecobacter sp.]|uniref:hypothetical protein n=1 Tax=Prosthecobacter sp. TaxID=1965333 RepID=UPI0037845559